MFDLSPDILLGSAPPIPAHALVAMTIAVPGLWQVVASKGTTCHRIPVTLFTLWSGVRRARSGRIREHASDVIILFILAIVVTGGFTLYPGRTLHETVFGADAGR